MLSRLFLLFRTLNGELHKALAAHSTNIHLLSLPLRELTEKIAPQNDITPGGVKIVKYFCFTAQTKEGEALMKVLDKAHEMQSQRAMLLDSFSKELEADNISKKLLAERDTDSQVQIIFSPFLYFLGNLRCRTQET